MNRENKQVSYIILSIYDALIFTIGLFSFLFGIVRKIKAEKVLDRADWLIGEEYMVTCDSLIVVGLILLIISGIIMIAVNKKTKEKNNSGIWECPECHNICDDRVQRCSCGAKRENIDKGEL